MAYNKFCKHCGIYQGTLKCWRCGKKTVKA